MMRRAEMRHRGCSFLKSGALSTFEIQETILHPCNEFPHCCLILAHVGFYFLHLKNSHQPDPKQPIIHASEFKKNESPQQRLGWSYSGHINQQCQMDQSVSFLADLEMFHGQFRCLVPKFTL